MVGPNGCGKSNVVDAMRWAMGEQSPRRLRGKGMEDVIFAGSDSRAPIGMAEVVLSFDNAEGIAPPAYASFSEIQIARRVYRSGESEYLINKVPCRLRDVQDFFRDTGIGTRGYTIVEQGQIAGIVSAKPEDRRYLIEEAAGISKYKARRREAESKIEATEQNLVRVSDVLGEIRRQIGTLERQAKKAARYKRLRETQRLLELSLAADDRADLVGQIEDLRRRFASLRDQGLVLEARVSERELALEAARLELAERERVVNQGNEVLVSLRGDIKQLESRIDYETRERDALAEMNTVRSEELATLGEQLAASETAAERAADELRALESGFDAEAGAIAAAEAATRQAEEAFRALERERDVANAALVDALTRLARAEDRLAALEDRRAEIDRRIRSADEGLELHGSEEAQAELAEQTLAEGLRNLLADRDRLMGALRAAHARSEEASRRAREAGESLREAREHRETRRARLASLREVIDRREDLGAASRHLLECDEATRTALGLRALARDVLEVDRPYERAIEAVLAERAEALVVRDLASALAAIEVLRSAKAGRGVFVVEPRLEAAPVGFVPLGRPLLECVRVRPGFEAVARSLLGGMNLVDDLREAVALYGAGRLPAGFVTPEGDLLSPDGVVRGGAEAAQSGLLSRVREVRELDQEVAELDRVVAAQEAARAAAELEEAAANDERENLRNRHHTAALAVANHEKDLERTRDRVKTLAVAHDDRVAERTQLVDEAEQRALEAERLAGALEETRRERSERQRGLEALILRMGQAGRELAREQAQLAARRVEYAGRLERRDALREAERRACTAVRETKEWIERRKAETAAAEVRRETLLETIQAARAALGERLREEEVARASSDAKREAYEREALRVQEFEAELRGLRGETTERRDETSRAELELRESEMRLSHLEEAVRARWSVELKSWAPPFADAPPEPAPSEAKEVACEPGEAEAAGEGEGSEEEAALTPRAVAELLALAREERRARLEDVRGRVEALGEVNLGAIEEHEELAERFRFLSEQKNDLESTLAALREAIQRINRTSRKRFRETFDAVNLRFQENFPRLFRGGKAKLQLTEEEDVLEAGIEIMASPPGKRVVNVNALSGGEKTLTAVALLVSVFQVRPSPFFLLDEVDAALDDANVGRFNEIVKELAKESQFLVVTHNKRTIEVADLLYGVTMEEKGVSKLVSVELH
ncbi:MAG TPA: chromosome segregation protein SMC [Deltaproteobacteria bacterium]|nr:chromosome segregation protein SMC [Deltaproteobacteria bacterium]